MAVGAAILAFQAFSSVAGASKDAQANKNLQRIANLQNKLAKLENVREVRNQIRQERILRGTVLARAATGGGGIDSSSSKGQTIGLASQLTANLDFLEGSQNINNEIAALGGEASRLQTEGSLFRGAGRAVGAFGNLYNAT